MWPQRYQVIRNLLKREVRRFQASTRKATVKVFSLAGLGHLFYGLLSRSFVREHQAVMSGRARYFQDLKQPRTSSALLRRNIHRIEKGLIMVPPKPVFAEDYIRETVDCLALASSTQDFSPGELKWASDVLDLYFETVKHSTVVSAAEAVFRQKSTGTGQAGERKPTRWVPYARTNRSTITDLQLEDLFENRVSVRWFENARVPKQSVLRAVELAATAPSACNRLPYRWLVELNPEEAGLIAACAGGTAGFAHQVPAIAVLVGDLSAFSEARDRHLIYIDASLAAMQFMLALESMGLSSCPINWPDMRSSDRKLAHFVSVERFEKVVMMIAIGVAKEDAKVPFSAKKRNDVLVSVRDSQ